MAEGYSGQSSNVDVCGDSFEDEPDLCACVVGENLKNNQRLLDALEKLAVPVVFSQTGDEYIKDDSPIHNLAFVLDDFEGEIFIKLKMLKIKRIWGPTFIYKCAEKGELLHTTEPLYCLAMQNIVVCFTGFRTRDDIFGLVKLIRYMGGSVRKDVTARITHLIANSTTHDKYKYAVTMGKAIMSQEWVYKVWERKNDVNCSATDEDLMNYKLPPFFDCRISFLWFSDDELKHVTQLAIENGAEVVSLENDSCTHVVVDEQNEKEFNEEIPSRAHVVRAEWFWATIQMVACADENIYYYKHSMESPPAKSTPITSSSLTTASRLRKRKRLRETLGQLAQLPDATPSDSRLSTDTLGLSLSGSFLDATVSPDKLSESENIHVDINGGASAGIMSPNKIKSPLDVKHMSGRQQVCLELLQTEKNYVGILNIIMTRFKEPLEMADCVRGPLLDPTEVKIIFGNMPPIFEVHKKIRDDLNALMSNWREDCSLGNVILKHSRELLKAYPPFVNFFEHTKEMLTECDKNKPRFHAFLKICQSKPECGRQTLSELLIRPVQRLPSIILLLNDVLKHTAKTNPDHPRLEEAVASLKEVLKNINENKRKTEGQVAMFDIINDIENCPPNLLSSHRTFVTKVDVIELSHSFGGKGDNLAIFVFSDMLEVCKRRTKMLSTLKSPSTASLRNQTKVYKHVELMPLSHVKRVVNILETEECKSVFALVCRSNQELKEKLYSFTIVSPDVDKVEFLRTLCRHVANTICRADVESFLTCLEPHQLDIETSEVTSSSLSKAMSRLASKTSRKVGRAFSFNRTPRKLKRAMSSMISPFQTPDLHERNMAHAGSSSVDLQEVDVPSGSRSAKVSKKGKSSSLGASSSKLL